jgi:hypothetical protein
MLTALPVLTVSAIFLTWTACRRERERRERRLRERVAYMLWVAAHQDDPPRLALRKGLGKKGPGKHR